MRYLVDTHILVWWVVGDFQLSKKAIKILLEPSNEVYVSLLSAWELSLKLSTKKLKLYTTIAETFRLSQFKTLPILFEHIIALNTLPVLHKDPFDRLLIAQAKVENLTLITSDLIIKKYPIKTLL